MSDDESKLQKTENDSDTAQSSKSKPTLVDATHKLKAEALRRLQLNLIEASDEQGNEEPRISSKDDLKGTEDKDELRNLESQDNVTRKQVFIDNDATLENKTQTYLEGESVQGNTIESAEDEKKSREIQHEGSFPLKENLDTNIDKDFSEKLTNNSQNQENAKGGEQRVESDFSNDEKPPYSSVSHRDSVLEGQLQRVSLEEDTVDNKPKDSVDGAIHPQDNTEESLRLPGSVSVHGEGKILSETVLSSHGNSSSTALEDCDTREETYLDPDDGNAGKSLIQTAGKHQTFEEEDERPAYTELHTGVSAVDGERGRTHSHSSDQKSELNPTTGLSTMEEVAKQDSATSETNSDGEVITETGQSERLELSNEQGHDQNKDTNVNGKVPSASDEALPMEGCQASDGVTVEPSVAAGSVLHQSEPKEVSPVTEPGKSNSLMAEDKREHTKDLDKNHDTVFQTSGQDDTVDSSGNVENGTVQHESHAVTLEDSTTTPGKRDNENSNTNVVSRKIDHTNSESGDACSKTEDISGTGTEGTNSIAKEENVKIGGDTIDKHGVEGVEPTTGDVIDHQNGGQIVDVNTTQMQREKSGAEEGSIFESSNENKAMEGNDQGATKSVPEETDEESERTVQEEEENLIPDDFYYDKEDYLSKPFVTDNIPSDLLVLHHSFGYECTKRSNLYMLDEANLIFTIGNYVEILNIQTKNQTYIRSISGGGIGSIVVHPSRKYFAVAEKGIDPYITIYEYPSLKLYRILRNGTQRAYSHLDFSPSGDKLASVGSYPDFMLTVWDWKQEKIVLRSKAFSQDVFKVAFSPEDEGHLCSSGTGHIRFWTIASTFTGLKLQGELGRFGTTELSDIAGFVELPDGKVLSGSEWGNMLLWDGSLIKVEIARKGKKFCHQGTIQQFYLDEGELITIGDDGYIKVWDFESIDAADAADESKIFEMEPMSELKVGAEVKLMFMVKSENPHESSVWYAQDANGGIWKLDLSFSHTSQKPVKIQSFHAGKINGVAASPLTHIAATVGNDGTVRLYDYLSKTPVCYQRFNSGATSVVWTPKVVDPDAGSILAGFADGVLRHLAISKSNVSHTSVKKEETGVSFKLIEVFKPHTKPITCIAINKDGTFLATGSEDCTVFIFSIGKTYTPIGFIEAGDHVVSLDWSSIKQGSTLLVCCRDGTVLEVACPEAGKFDTSKSFKLPLGDLIRREFRFKSIKDDLVKAELEMKKAKEEEEKKKQEEEERKRKIQRAIVEDEEEEKTELDGERDDVKDEEEGEDNNEVIEEPETREPGCIVKGFYRGEQGRFWLSLDGWDTGYLYECSFSAPSAEVREVEPVRAVKLDEEGESVVSSCHFSKKGQFLAMGLDNGAVKICQLENGDISNLSSFWMLNVHDNHSGCISDITMSFDEQFLMTTGADGNFFVYSFLDEQKLKEALNKKTAQFNVKKEIHQVKPVDDIEDPNFYSIELEKQKAEYDKMVELAEDKKQSVRQTISLCRREFKKLQNTAKELPAYLQLSPEEFIIDPEIKNEIEKETSEKIALLQREMAWESEKQQIALDKVHKRFKSMIEIDRIVLRAFNSEHQVASYRAAKLPEEFHFVLREHRKVVRRGTKLDGDAFLFHNVRRMSLTNRRLFSKGNTAADDSNKTKEQGPGNVHGKVSKAIEKADQRRQRRVARQAEWEELFKRKPDENYEDPADVQAIKEAEQNIGDFKLKTAKDFVVPESQRVNTEKKRLQLMELQERVYQLRSNFNQKLLRLRDKKLEAIDEVKELIYKIEHIQNQLHPSLHIRIPCVPKMLPEEQPERAYEFTKEQLMKFKEGLEANRDQGQGGYDEGGVGGFGGFGGEAPAASTKAPSLLASTKTAFDQRGRSTSILSSASSQPHSTSSLQHDRGSPETIFEEHQSDEQPSTVQLEIEEEEKIRLMYQRDQLFKNVRKLQEFFDAELRTLRHEKLLLDVELKNANLREITLFEELMLLKEFEKRENSLFSKVTVKLDEREEMREKVEECQLKIEAKKEEIEKLQEKEKALYTTFSQTVGENNKFEAFLTKVFKKKIKRAKRKEENADSDEDSDEEDSDDDYDSDEEEDSDREELDDSVCPQGCDQSIFDQVCHLREKRLDIEEAMTEEKKLNDSLKKEMDALNKKVKIIDSALKTAEGDLEAFQREKQQRLNEFDVVVTLRLSQLKYVVNNTIPQDLQECLVFNSHELERLQRRIKELEKEKIAQKKLYKHRRQQHAQLIRDKKIMENTILELEEKVKQTQMLKFGRLIDLEKLETISVNRVAEELKEKLRAEEFSSANDIADWEKKIDAYKARLTQVTRDNTRRLDTCTHLLQEKKDLEHQLDSRQKNLGGEFQGNRQADLEERQRLVQLVQLQSREIEALKDEVNVLSRKGGHVLPPSQPPLPSSGRASTSR